MFKSLIANVRLFLKKQKEPYLHLKTIMGFAPYDLSLYDQALLHRSVARRNDKGRLINNERLEFLGDSVLDTIVADILYQRYELKREGFLTNTRSKIVQRDSLNRLAVGMGLDKIMVVSSSVRANSSCIYGNGLEALVGAIYLDLGYRKAKAFVERQIINPFIDLHELSQTEVNFKSRLIEWSQKNRIEVQFNVVEIYTNKQEAQLFDSEVCLAGIPAGNGTGTSKKEAQQHASEAAFVKLHQDMLFRREVLSILDREKGVPPGDSTVSYTNSVLKKESFESEQLSSPVATSTKDAAWAESIDSKEGSDSEGAGDSEKTDDLKESADKRTAPKEVAEPVEDNYPRLF